MKENKELMDKLKSYEKDLEKTKILIITEKIIKIIVLSLVAIMFFLLLINKTFILSFFTTNFESYINYLNFVYDFLSLENTFSDILDVNFIIPIINISIPKAISLVFLLIIYILSIKNIINKNNNYMDCLDNKPYPKNPILLSLKFILSVFWAIFKIIFFYIMTLLILTGLILLIFNFIVPYFEWFIDFTGGTAKGILLGLFSPFIVLSILISFFSGGYSGSSGEQRSATVIYDKDGKIDWIATDVQQNLENEQIYNKKKE